MFRIYDGRKEFYQWDKNQKLIVEDSSITEVHFANCLCANATVVTTYEEEDITLVDVPETMLQEYLDIKVYAYDGEKTKHEESFKVNKRTKPADYIYTGEEVKTWEQVYKDLCQYQYYSEVTDCFDTVKVPYLPFESFTTTKEGQRWNGAANPTISNPRLFDVQEEIKLYVDDNYTSYERVAKFPMPAYMWSIDWLTGEAYIRMVCVKLDISKVYEGENKGCLYTTFEEQGWVQIRNGITPICSHFTQGLTLSPSRLRMMEDGKLRLCVNSTYTYEEALEAVKDLEIYFCYQPEEDIISQVCEPLETTSQYSDNGWFYAYTEGIEEDNIRWGATYYEALSQTFMKLGNRIIELENRLAELEG